MHLSKDPSDTKLYIENLGHMTFPSNQNMLNHLATLGCDTSRIQEIDGILMYPASGKPGGLMCKLSKVEEDGSIGFHIVAQILLKSTILGLQKTDAQWAEEDSIALETIRNNRRKLGMSDPAPSTPRTVAIILPESDEKPQEGRIVKEKLAKLKEYMPGEDDIVYEFAKYFSEGMSDYTTIAPAGFHFRALLLVGYLQDGVDGHGKPIVGRIGTYPKVMYPLFFELHIARIAEAVFGTDYANEVRAIMTQTTAGMKQKRG